MRERARPALHLEPTAGLRPDGMSARIWDHSETFGRSTAAALWRLFNASRGERLNLSVHARNRRDVLSEGTTETQVLTEVGDAETRLSEAAQSDLLRHAPVGLMTIDMRGNVVAHNLMLALWRGHPAADASGALIGENALDWLSADSRALLKRIKNQIIHRDLTRVSPLAVPVLLEIGRDSIKGSADDALLAEAADALMDEASRLV